MDIVINKFASKEEMYKSLITSFESTVKDVYDLYAILSNASSVLNLYLDNINWVGFYLLKNSKLVLGPFQGKPAVSYIEIGKGVCGSAVKDQETKLVENVHNFCGHIACDINSKSEIVVPMYLDNNIFGVLDIDSPIYSRFDKDDQMGLESFLEVLMIYIKKAEV